jgi:hypothetical protein
MFSYTTAVCRNQLFSKFFIVPTLCGPSVGTRSNAKTTQEKDAHPDKPFPAGGFTLGEGSIPQRQERATAVQLPFTGQ